MAGRLPFNTEYCRHIGGRGREHSGLANAPGPYSRSMGVVGFGEPVAGGLRLAPAGPNAARRLAIRRRSPAFDRYRHSVDRRVPQFQGRGARVGALRNRRRRDDRGRPARRAPSMARGGDRTDRRKPPVASPPSRRGPVTGRLVRPFALYSGPASSSWTITGNPWTLCMYRSIGWRRRTGKRYKCSVPGLLRITNVPGLPPSVFLSARGVIKRECLCFRRN